MSNPIRSFQDAINLYLRSEEKIQNGASDLRKKNADFKTSLSHHPDYIKATYADSLYKEWESITQFTEQIEQAKRDKAEAEEFIIKHLKAFNNKPIVASFTNRNSAESRWKFSLDEKGKLKVEEYYG